MANEAAVEATPVAVVRHCGSIIAAPWNARTGHDLDGIAESIRVNGFRDPSEVWATQLGERLPEPHEIVAGEGRWRAAAEVLGMDVVPVVEQEFGDLQAAQRYAIANNRLTDKSGFDAEVLLVQLDDLPDLYGTGFGDDELADLRAAQTVPGDEGWDDGMGLPDGAQPGMRVMTFTLSPEQQLGVAAAIKKAQDEGPFVDTGNENSNGNALARITETYNRVG